ncbi:DUF192 domain-containing protein [Rariglobus hedericola]|uniref:DUF192 domain-containing protein n=2 Tax=Rariglobus hedericola TaxID=2597822 RepID=A0A556QSX4_9BACT|nr:DUF192 domain-containing protein [Rariglobus hedericola]
MLLRVVVLFAALLMTTGCGRSDAALEQSAPKTVADFFVITVGDKPVNMQLAVRPREMERGLMDRRDLKADEGMLFLYLTPQQMSFWMRNTPTPLDIGFFTADGVLKEIYPMYPYDETPVRSQSEQLKFALEMNQGWFSANKVKVGAKLDLKALAAALKARGFEPWEYGVR